MSARGTFRKRSSSLSTLNARSRATIGVGQHGAQRVSGVGCDSRVRNSGGNSMMLLFFTPNVARVD